MNSIGGYFELELTCNNNVYHEGAIQLNKKCFGIFIESK